MEDDQEEDMEDDKEEDKEDDMEVDKENDKEEEDATRSRESLKRRGEEIAFETKRMRPKAANIFEQDIKVI